MYNNYLEYNLFIIISISVISISVIYISVFLSIRKLIKLRIKSFVYFSHYLVLFC